MPKKRNYVVTTHSPKELLFGLHYTVEHEGKMQGIESISTSNHMNPSCISNMNKKGFVCQHCFSTKIQRRYSKLSIVLEDNYEIMKDIAEIDECEIPITTCVFFRFQAFGDMQSTDEMMFYLRICKKNPQTHFALWTKRMEILETVFKKERKPENLSVVYSEPIINTPNDTVYPGYIDHVFTVFTKEYAEKNGIEINCGDSVCVVCRKCYMQRNTYFINELLK